MKRTAVWIMAGVAAFGMAGRPADAQNGASGPITDEAVRLSEAGVTMLPPDYVRSALGGRYAAILAEVDTPARRKSFPSARARVAMEARDALHRLEKAFILDPSASSLDLLPPAERERYESFAWDKDDYPGGPVGPHEDVAIAMVQALSRVRPERRANSNASAVVRESEFNDPVWAYIQAQEHEVPGQAPRKLNRFALASFEAMAADAARDGVTLTILSSNRLPQTAAANAARTNNAYAVARFSSHILGLAMDLKMSDGRTAFDETTTVPMSNIIAMRRSAVHKWMFLHGAAYGWYPYQHEPWHWEYNPPGFREKFWKEYKAGQ